MNQKTLLIIAAVLFVGGVYFFLKEKKDKKEESPDPEKPEDLTLLSKEEKLSAEDLGLSQTQFDEYQSVTKSMIDNIMGIE